MTCKYGVCKCAHSHDHGACPTFEAGMNGRCVYCDHAKECHSLRVPGPFNTPLGVSSDAPRRREAAP